MRTRVSARFALLLAVGCGRISFDPTADGALDRDGSPDVSADGGISGLVAWFPLDDPSGSTFVDVVGGATGSCMPPNCPTLTTGHRGAGYLFDGIDDCIAVPNSGAFSPAQLTVAIWARQDQVGGPSGVSQVSKRVDVMATALNSWQAETLSSGVFVFTSNHGSAANDSLASTGTISLGVWHHLAIAYDGATKTVFVDGIQKMSRVVPAALAYDTHPVQIGCDDNQTIGEPWPGALDELFVFDRALSPAEIATLASW